MSFTDQKPFLVTQEHLDARWCGERAPFAARRHLRCAWCGHRFELGDTARWVYTNGGDEETKGISGNPFICQPCDGPRSEILSKLRSALAEANGRMWWFTKHDREGRDG